MTNTIFSTFKPVPRAATKSHLLPGLHKYSLLSITKLCNNGCTIKFTKGKCKIYYKGLVIMTGPCNLSTKLWIINFNNDAPHHQMTTKGEHHAPHHPSPIELCNNVHNITGVLNFSFPIPMQQD